MAKETYPLISWRAKETCRHVSTHKRDLPTRVNAQKRPADTCQRTKETCRHVSTHKRDLSIHIKTQKRLIHAMALLAHTFWQKRTIMAHKKDLSARNNAQKRPINTYQHTCSCASSAPMSRCCNILQHTAKRCNTLQQFATHCNTLQRTCSGKSSASSSPMSHCYNTLQHTVTHCNTLQCIAILCDTLQYTAAPCNTRQHVAARCITLLYAAKHCNTLQHTCSCKSSVPSSNISRCCSSAVASHLVLRVNKLVNVCALWEGATRSYKKRRGKCSKIQTSQWDCGHVWLCHMPIKKGKTKQYSSLFHKVNKVALCVEGVGLTNS